MPHEGFNNVPESANDNPAEQFGSPEQYAKNLSSLANIFEMNYNTGEFKGAMERYATDIAGIIQRYTEYPVRDGMRSIGDPFAYAERLKKAKEQALKEQEGDEATQAEIRKLWSHVEIPGA